MSDQSGYPDNEPPTGWLIVAGKLHREFEFSDFNEAWGFLERVAYLAEKHNHHPELHNSEKHVVIDLVSHDWGTITGRDRRMAAAINNVV
jgi:4a-hydroxytetrahydrobiopterin dehydratase